MRVFLSALLQPNNRLCYYLHGDYTYCLLSHYHHYWIEFFLSRWLQYCRLLGCCFTHTGCCCRVSLAYIFNLRRNQKKRFLPFWLANSSRIKEYIRNLTRKPTKQQSGESQHGAIARISERASSPDVKRRRVIFEQQRAQIIIQALGQQLVLKIVDRRK